MRRKQWVALGAALLALWLLVAEAGPVIAEAWTNGGQVPQTRVIQLAKSKKKKKKTATPQPAATETPAPSGKPEAAVPAGTLDVTATPVPEGPIIDPQGIADYLFEHGELPDNFLTKAEAQALGWDSTRNFVSDVAPGMSIGGDRFGNYEGQLPTVRGRYYFEADCYYVKGRRNAYRIIFSDDGHVWYTKDHYQTFQELFPSVPAMTSAP